MLNRLNPKSLIPALCVIAATGLGAPSFAATVYISDELTVPLRSGPSGGHRILHRGLPSGTQMEVIGQDEEAGFTQIRTTRGTEGWIRTQYLVSEPIAKARLAAAQRAEQRAKQALAQEREKVTNLTQETNAQSQSNTSNERRIRQLEEELSEIKRLSATAIETHAENQKLTEVNARLQDELDDVAEIRAQLEDNNRNEALIIGGALLFIGLIAGVMIKARPQRSAWN